MAANKNYETGGKDTGKVVVISLLLALSGSLIISGAFFCVYSIYTNTTFRVLNSNIPGVIFGAVVLYLGIRYFLSVFKLKKELYKSTAQFSWSNFRKQTEGKSK